MAALERILAKLRDVPALDGRTLQGTCSADDSPVW